MKLSKFHFELIFLKSWLLINHVDFPIFQNEELAYSHLASLKAVSPTPAQHKYQLHRLINSQNIQKEKNSHLGRYKFSGSDDI